MFSLICPLSVWKEKPKYLLVPSLDLSISFHNIELQLEELRADIVDLKEMYREQVSLLVNKVEGFYPLIIFLLFYEFFWFAIIDPIYFLKQMQMLSSSV